MHEKVEVMGFLQLEVGRVELRGNVELFSLFPSARSILELDPSSGAHPDRMVTTARTRMDLGFINRRRMFVGRAAFRECTQG